MTDATGVTTYTYDAANRLTSAGGVAYTWDARGNLASDGTFTYTHNAAGRMVRAYSLTSTVVYTYNASGLRVARSVNGEVTSFAWDWATGVPEMLSEGQAMGSSIALYLMGHETLGQWDGADWAYYLPDALGSIRQETDGTGAVTDSREWTPFGVEVGTAQEGLGYAGEWLDGSIGFLYLRARWYESDLGRFTSRDPFSGRQTWPQSQNPYPYTANSPVNYVDPSGIYCDFSSSDCMQFASEVEDIVRMTQNAVSNWLTVYPVYPVPPDQLGIVGGWFANNIALAVIAHYYAGIDTFVLDNIPAFSFLGIPTLHQSYRQDIPERYPVPECPTGECDYLNQCVTCADPPVISEYGFKRPYWHNTHHYAGALWYAAHLPPVTYEFITGPFEGLQLFEAVRGGDWEAVKENQIDLLMVNQVALAHAYGITFSGIDQLPSLIRSNLCIKNAGELYLTWILHSVWDG